MHWFIFIVPFTATDQMHIHWVQEARVRVEKRKKVDKAVEQITAFCIQGRMKNGIKCIPASQSMRYKRGKIAFYENVYALKKTKKMLLK